MYYSTELAYLEGDGRAFVAYQNPSKYPSRLAKKRYKKQHEHTTTEIHNTNPCAHRPPIGAVHRTRTYYTPDNLRPCAAARGPLS